MRDLTEAQRRQLARMAGQIATLGGKALVILDDDPMHGAVWSALNRIISDADMVASTVTK